jgi:hypothetical protein
VSDRKQAPLVKVEERSTRALQEDAISALLNAPTVEAAAAAAGVRESVLRTWLKDPKFGAEYQAARIAVISGAIVQLQLSAARAVEALTRNLTCGIPVVEVEAAKVILDQAVHGMERALAEPPLGRGRGPAGGS